MLKAKLLISGVLTVTSALQSLQILDSALQATAAPYTVKGRRPVTL